MVRNLPIRGVAPKQAATWGRGFWRPPKARGVYRIDDRAHSLDQIRVNDDSPIGRPTAAASGEQGADEDLGIERQQIAELLTDPDEPHRHVQGVLDGEDDPAFGG